MTAKLTLTDIQFLLDNILLGNTPAPGADTLAPDGIRTIDGTQNNITGLTLFDQFGNLVDSGTFGNVSQGFVDTSSTVGPNSYGINPVVIDATPRQISNLIVDTTGANPAAATAALLSQGDPSVDRLPENSLFTFFGQFFDHGLDFISKQGSGVIMIPILPGDPLFDTSPGAFNMMPVTRAELDANGDPINTTAPFIEQSQTYGSAASTTFYLKEYDVNGVATGDLVQGVDGMGTWADIKDNANLWARAQAGADPLTKMLTDADILDVPDPTFWDPLLNAGLGGFAPGAGTGQAFSADIAHNANPSGGLTPDTDDFINPHGFGNPPPDPGEYDNELLDAHLITGDPRANENGVLTSIHTAFHSEHSRLVAEIKDWIQQQNQIDPNFAGQWTGEMIFEAAKFANEMQYQHMAFEEFGRRMSPNIDEFGAYQVDINPNITTEFSQAVYRLGHSLLTDTVKTMDASGQITDLTLIDAFLNPERFSQFGAADFLKGGQFEQGSRIDEFVVDALRNFLVGLPLDLAAINIARGRDVDLPTLNELRADIFAQTGDASFTPYVSWNDFGAHLLNPASLVNFIAAYSNEASIVAARNNGLSTSSDDARAAAAVQMGDAAFMGVGGDGAYNLIDLWIGGLAEEKVPLGLLGTTFDFIFAQQMLSLQNGDRFYYLARIGGNLLDQIESQTFADILMRGTGATHLNLDVFGTADELIELGTLAVDHLIKTPAELTAFIAEVIGGTNANNMIYGGAGNDTIYGEGGNDVIMAGANDDHVDGGDGDDVIHGEVGFDFLRGGDGNDEIHGGADGDHILGGTGNDVLFGDQGLDEMLGMDGNDVMHGGNQDDTMLGGEGNDVMFGDDGDDGMDGESGNDILFGGRGDDTMTGAEGDDMFFGGAGADSMDGGLGGYDIASYETWLDTLPLGTGMGLTINMLDSALSTGDARDDSYADIEVLRGTNFDDFIVGDDFGHTLVGGHGADNITGGLLDDVLIGSEGNDSLFGGGGVDTVLVRGIEADFTLSFAIGGLDLTDDEIVLSTNEGTDFVSSDITWLSFDDALLNLNSGQYAPLIGLTNTDERMQNGTPVIGEAIANIVVNDGDSLSGSGKYLADIDIADPDGANGGPRVFTLSGADAAAFTIRNIGGINQLFLTGGGPLSFANFDAKPFYHVTITVADTIGESAINYTLEVTDLNDNAPVFTSGNRVNVQQGVSTATIVYRADTSDLDTTVDLITYTLGGADAANFALVDGELRFLSSPSLGNPLDADMDNTYEVTIDATDGMNSAVQQNVSIHVGGGGVITGTPGPDNPLVGTSAADVILGLDGNDNIMGLAGNDILNGGLGQDILDGGADNDTATYVDSAAGVQSYLNLNKTLAGGDGFDTLLNIENLTGSAFADRLVGDGNDNVLNGGDGADILKGKGGNDTFFGGDGADKMVGGAGNDVMHGGAGMDILISLAGIDELNGGADADFLYGGQDADVLNGDGGDDVLRGNLGSDVLNGGTGSDTLRGGGNIDTLNGGADNDFLFGEGASDTLFGGAGNDSLTGGFGGGILDMVTDTFIFSDTASGGGGFDRVKDWEDTIDLIDLTSFGFVDFTTEVLTLASDTMTGLRVDFGGGDVLFLENFLLANFDATDVLI